jgi:hypothetical protein
VKLAQYLIGAQVPRPIDDQTRNLKTLGSRLHTVAFQALNQFILAHSAAPANTHNAQIIQASRHDVTSEAARARAETGRNRSIPMTRGLAATGTIQRHDRRSEQT